MRTRSFLPALLYVVLAVGCVSRQVPPPAFYAPKNLPEAKPAARVGAIGDRMLAAHNAWRKKVNVAPLKWSESLAGIAQAWADTLRTEGCRMEHRPAGAYGENLAWAGGQRLTPEEVLELWGREAAFYDHDANSCRAGKSCLHYTQVVWRNTTEVGCAVARCEDSEVWVCNYAPPGNWAGEKPY